MIKPNIGVLAAPGSGRRIPDIGLIADTHGLLRPEAIGAAADSTAGARAPAEEKER